MIRRIVVSALNISEGGALTILRECLSSAVDVLGSEWEIIAFVHDRRLINVDGVKYIEIRLPRRAWLTRLYYEFWFFRKLSIRFDPDVWLSIRDISPWVKARRQVVYCHNALPFFKMTWRQALLEPTSFLHSIFYRYLYRLNIDSNSYVIVQQEWLRKSFSAIYGLTNVVVAYPNSTYSPKSSPEATPITPRVKVFFYPALSRIWKNFEILFDAVTILNSRGVSGFEVRLTITADENKYSRSLSKTYGDLPGLSLIGRQSFDAVVDEYKKCDVVIFPSVLESWGLPISEAKQYCKSLMIANLPYAHEAVGRYESVVFFDPLNAEALADLMQNAIEGKSVFGATQLKIPPQPFVEDWHALMRLITATV